MSRASLLIKLTVGLVGILACAYGAEAGKNPTDADVLSVRAVGGIIIQYPREWKAAVTKDGKVVAVAGPARGSVRPAATFLMARGRGDLGKMLDSATNGLGKQTLINLLGERHLTPSRWARYYLRGEGVAAEYVMVGIAQDHGWVVTMVGVDAASDPMIQVHAEVLQGLLAAVVFPTH